jgi:hypothetical protein
LGQLGVSRDREKSGVPSDRGKERGGIAGNSLKHASERYEWNDKIESVDSRECEETPKYTNEQ